MKCLDETARSAAAAVAAFYASRAGRPAVLPLFIPLSVKSLADGDEVIDPTPYLRVFGPDEAAAADGNPPSKGKLARLRRPGANGRRG